VGIVAQQKAIVEQDAILHSAAVTRPVLQPAQPQEQLILPVGDVVAPAMVVIHVSHRNAALNSKLNAGKSLWVTANRTTVVTAARPTHSVEKAARPVLVNARR
jgi:hypothetical protein